MTTLKRIVIGHKSDNSKEDREYHETMAQLDDIFENGKKQISEGKEVPFREYIKGVRARLNGNTI